MDIPDKLIHMLDTIKPYSTNEITSMEVKRIESYVNQIQTRYEYAELGIELQDKQIHVWIRTKPLLDQLVEVAESIEEDREFTRRTITSINHEDGETHTFGEVSFRIPREKYIEEADEDGVEDEAVEEAA